MFNLAQGRDSQFLWRSLQNREVEFPDTVCNLVALRNLADFKRPFELINHILITQGGRSRLLGQLGLEAAEGIDALVSQSLIYEQSNVPSLTGFLVWLDSDELIIKRQMDTIEDKIRVMTVHGAKGLEAPIVILPDTAARSAPTTPDVVDHHGLAVWKPNKNLVPEILNPTLDKLKLRQVDELDRLLYVALTRAESWLIVMGSGDIKEETDCWYNAIHAAVVVKGAVPLITTAGIGLRYEPKPWRAGTLRQIDLRKKNNHQVPDWVKPTTSTTPPSKSPRAPSDLGGEKIVSDGLTLVTPDARRLGTAIHLLLETLPNTPEEKWKIVAKKIVDADIFSFAWAEAKEILYHPDLAHIFASATFGEVNVSAHIDELNGDPIQGSIDRLIISNDTVLAIDFKTNQIVPKTPKQVPEGILRQLGAYASALQQIFPDHQVETAILWTKTCSLMKLPNHLVITSLEGVSPS